jgi:hypothetical protein
MYLATPFDPTLWGICMAIALPIAILLYPPGGTWMGFVTAWATIAYGIYRFFIPSV